MRKTFSYVIVVAALTLGVAFTATCVRQNQVAAASPTASDSGIEVYFSPKGGCTEAVVKELEAATKTIDIQAYSFTSVDIAKAVVDAQARGVKVRAILDKTASRERYTEATFLFNHKVPTYIDGKHAIAHNKIILIDGATIITGSFNFTKAAESSNAENLLILKDKPNIFEAYAKNFELHLGHSEAYTGLEKSDTDSPQGN